ncbi:EAL domain-containing protein [Novosphingobium sp. CECT 9465]|uniref:EAL domain-containing protein n=1 Tax=Novosphingobium sp. CECT 9465 TaxID=2829794 RepID=UPI001E496BED|nr:EAL domain-containing protein [Novosphingobium sp. CECT 9465]CAH0496445.1 hypothetical protein NVSP9465_01479 [Novosphingobium sp. CECT 9465]
MRIERVPTGTDDWSGAASRSVRAPQANAAVGADPAPEILLFAVRIDNLDAIGETYGAAVAERVSREVQGFFRQRLESARDLVGGVVGRSLAEFDLIVRGRAVPALMPRQGPFERIEAWMAAAARLPIPGPGWTAHVSLSWSYVEADDFCEDRELFDLLLAEARGRLPGLVRSPLALGAERAVRDMAAAAALYAELNAAGLQFAWQPVCGLDGDTVLYLRAFIAAPGRDGQIEDRQSDYRAMERQGLAQAFDQALVAQAVEHLARCDNTHSVCMAVSASSFRSSAWWDSILARLGCDRALARRLFIAIDCAQCFVSAGEAVAFADRLRRCGARIVLEGLGSGQIAISTLIALRPDVVTLDALFLRLAAPREPDEQLFRRIVSLASALAPAVVVEGVEDAARAACALEAGIHWGIGSHLAQPSWRGPSRTGSGAAQVSAFGALPQYFSSRREGSQ